jgi:pSer/pThr/pTyr-binding forkhead associated (FHA) protein
LAFLIVKRGEAGDVGKIFELAGDSLIVGRRNSLQRPDIELGDDVISRRHLEIILRDGKYMIRDLNSTNGTMLDDDRILPEKCYELKHNCKIGLGIDGDKARVVLLFKETESTNIIVRKELEQEDKVQSASSDWLKIDEAKKEVWVDGRQKKLSRKEYCLLTFLFKNAGRICSRDEIIHAVWPESKDPGAISDATIDQLVHRLRQKVEPCPSNPVRIVSKKAFGYILI